MWVNVRKCGICDVIFVEAFSGSGGVRYAAIGGYMLSECRRGVVVDLRLR